MHQSIMKGSDDNDVMIVSLDCYVFCQDILKIYT